MAKLHFNYGTMNSGKSTRLIASAYNYESLGYPVAVVKPDFDKRHPHSIYSRAGNLLKECDIIISQEDSLRERLRLLAKWPVNAVFVDEVHSLTLRQAGELPKIAKVDDIPVLAYGLINSYQGEGFPASDLILRRADEKVEIPTLCRAKSIHTKPVKAREHALFVDNEPYFGGTGIELDKLDDDSMQFFEICGNCRELHHDRKLKVVPAVGKESLPTLALKTTVELA